MTRKVLTDVCPNCGAQVTFVIDEDSEIIQKAIQKYIEKKARVKLDRELEKGKKKE